MSGSTPSFSTFPAGAPQIAAAPAKSWDVGGTGSVPAVLGAARFGILTIGITNDESKANALMVRGDKFEAIKANPQTLKGQRLLLTTNSTVDYAARSCLEKFGLAQTDMQFVNLGQAQIISAITSNNGDFAGVWAPNTYTLEESANAKYLCSGADAGAIVPGALVVRADYAKEHPEDVAKFLAVYLRGWAWAKANPAEARAMTLDFYKQGGVEMSRPRDGPGVRAAADLRPRRAAQDDGAQQRRVESTAGSARSASSWSRSAPSRRRRRRRPSSRDEFMKRVAADPKLQGLRHRIRQEADRDSRAGTAPTVRLPTAITRIMSMAITYLKKREQDPRDRDRAARAVVAEMLAAIERAARTPCATMR